MKKRLKKIIILTAIAMLSATGCSQKKSKEIKTFSYEKNDKILENINYNICELKVPDNAGIYTFGTYDKTIYYCVDYTGYFEQITQEQIMPEFSEEYNTQIRAYNMETGEDNLIFQYNESKCVKVTDLQCNGKELIWEDYIGNGQAEWRINKISLDEKSGIEENILKNNERGLLTSITPVLTENNIYWYDMLEDDSINPIILYEYDIRNKGISVKDKNLDLMSPYEHINILDNTYATYSCENDNQSVIHITDISKNKQTDILVNDKVSVPVSNGKICVWTKGYDYGDREGLYVYNVKNKQYEKINTPYIFSYGLVGDYIIINNLNGLYVYDTINKQYADIIQSDTIPCGYTFQNISGEIYAEIYDDIINVMDIIVIGRN